MYVPFSYSKRKIKISNKLETLCSYASNVFCLKNTNINQKETNEKGEGKRLFYVKYQQTHCNPKYTST